MRIFLGMIGALTLAGNLAAQTTYVACGQLIDVEALEVLSARTIVVDGGRILKVDPGFTSPPADVRLVDLRDHTCMPGLIDLHVHLSSASSPASTVERFTLTNEDLAYRSVAYAERTLMAGFTTVRDLGNAVGPRMRVAIAEGRIVGPRMFVAGLALASTGGHGDPTNGWRPGVLDEPGPGEGVINSPEDGRQAVRQRYKEGVDLIKITATGGVLSLAPNGEGPQMTEEEIRAIVETARDYGFHVAAHAHGAEGLKRAVRAGVRTIEHGTLMDDEGIELMRERGTYYVPTISAGEFVAEKAAVEGYYPEMVRVKAAAIGPQIRSTFARAYAAGVPIAFGTDSGVGDHGTNGREFEYMVEAGMPVLEAIRSATLTAATVLDAADRLGTIAPGKLADIVAVAEDPTDNVSVMERVSFVMKDGVVYKSPGD